MLDLRTRNPHSISAKPLCGSDFVGNVIGQEEDFAHEEGKLGDGVFVHRSAEAIFCQIDFDEVGKFRIGNGVNKTTIGPDA